jgi:hypothetical protein
MLNIILSTNMPGMCWLLCAQVFVFTKYTHHVNTLSSKINIQIIVFGFYFINDRTRINTQFTTEAHKNNHVNQCQIVRDKFASMTNMVMHKVCACVATDTTHVHI